MTPDGATSDAGATTDADVTSGAGMAPDEIAIVDGDETTTWAELERRCEAVAAAVTDAGVSPGGLVALAADPASSTIIGLLGILRAGATAAPIPARLTPAERAAALALLRPVASLDSSGVFRLERPRDDRPDGAQDWNEAVPGRVLEGPGVVVLTSGTTAAPRGVILSLDALRASAEAWIAALPPAGGWLLAVGLGHVAGLGVVWRAIDRHVPIRIADGTDPAALLAALAADGPGARPSHVSLVPAQLIRLLDHAGDAPPPSSLRAVPLGGGTIDPALVTRALECGWPVVPTYGLSEAGSGVTALATGEAREVPGSAGRPLPGVQVSIEDADADGVGEIVVRSQAAFSGYLDGPPRRAGDPIRTGDLGRIDEVGRLWVIDRRTDRIVRGGENIAPSEVEQVLVAHPAVADAAVVARPDPTWGQVPVAALVGAPGVPRPDDAALADHCRTSLAGFKVPVAYAWVETLPRTSGGKLQRAAVRARLTGPVPGALDRPDGVRIGWRTTGSGPRQILLLHGTLSNAGQLDRLATELARSGALTVHAVDRRASGTSRVADPSPVDVALHVEDLLAVMDHLDLARATLVGLSYGAVLALETAARHPDRVEGVVAWEPPFGPVADPAQRAQLAAMAAAVEHAYRTGGAPAAAETFLRAVAGDAAWERLSARGRAFLASEGDGALADSGLVGVDAASPARIRVPVMLLTGGTSEPFYAPIAAALAERIPGARTRVLGGLGHAAPLTEPATVAAAITDTLEAPR